MATDQTATGQSVFAATVTLTWPTKPAAGTKALVVVGTPEATITSVKDNGAVQSTFTADAAASVGVYPWAMGVYRADGITPPASGSYAVTITLSGTAFAVASGRTYTGLAAGGPAAVNSNSGTGTAVTTGNVTPAVAGSLVIGGFADDSGVDPETITLTTSGATSIYTATDGTFEPGAVAQNIVASTTATGFAWTLGDSVNWAAIAAVYSPAAAVNRGAFFALFGDSS